MIVPDQHDAAPVRYEKVIDLRGLLIRARDALYDAADPGGAPLTYRQVADEVAELIVALDQEANR